MLPYASLNQPIVANTAANAFTSFFFQYGRGYEIPDLATFYVNDPTLNATTPNETSTYQAGFVGKSNESVWDIDYYTINFSNLQSLLNVDINGNPCASCAYTAYFDVGGARYQGIEMEPTAASAAAPLCTELLDRLSERADLQHPSQGRSRMDRRARTAV